ncbi:minor tail protein [Mycobacterium phage Funsized]|nr:minor tail protein [Mycobacterium phage Funsized]
MSAVIPGRPPATDAEWARSVEDRLRTLANPRTVRVGPWVIGTDGVTGNLLATRPGQSVVIDDTGATEVLPARKVDLSGYVTGDQLTAAIGGIDTTPDLGQIAESLFTDLYNGLVGLLNPVDALGQLVRFFKLELGGPILSNRLPVLPLSHIRNVQPNLLVDGSFDSEDTLAGFPDWDYDEADGHSRPGCAYTMADGTTHTLHSNPIEVGVGDTFDFEAWGKWSNLVVAAGASNPIQVAVASYTADNVLIGGAPQVITAVGGAGGSAAWQGGVIATAWAPPATADYIVLELTVASTATAGAVKFDDLVARKTGTLPQSYVSGLVGALQDAATGLQNLINQIWTGVTRQILDGPKSLPDLFHALGNIPPVSIIGVGAGTIIDTFTETWNQLWGGAARQIASGDKSIADAANAVADVSTNADNAVQIGEWNNAILGIRDNKPFDSGMDPTAVSMFPIPAATASSGEPVYLNATAASVPVAFWIAPEDATRGSIQWLGKGNANITAFYIDVYRVDATGAHTLIHTSNDLFPSLTAGLKLLRYDMPTAARVTVAHGDILAFAFRVQGTGTHQIGARFGLVAGDTTQVPQRPSGIRTATYGLVGNLTAGQAATIYGGDVPWVAFGIVTGDVAPPYYAPRTTTFTTPGWNYYDIPTWAKYVDVIMVGAGGSGHGGDGGLNRSGEGGGAGQWATETLQRGVDFPANATQIAIWVGAGGNAVGKETNGVAGQDTFREAITGGKVRVTATGGLRGDQYDTESGARSSTGQSPGSITYLGVPYAGGGTASGGNSSNGATGSAPGGGGGGGGGGVYTVAWGGGAGARGGAWAVARQS